MKRNSIDQIITLINVKIRRAEKMTQDEIYNVVQKYIQYYYDEFDPEVYIRTDKFLNSLIKTDIVQVNGRFRCNVRINNDYLTYKYPGKPNWSGNIDATGEDVVQWANIGSHGGLSPKDGNVHFWDDALEELGGVEGIKKMMIENLKKVGL